jgi:CHRD domain
MKTNMKAKVIQTLLVLTVLFGALGEAAAHMALPTGVSVFAYPAVSAPLTNDNPALARPIAFGDVALGGDTVSVQVAMNSFEDPVDLYLALVAPAVTPYVFLFTPSEIVLFTGILAPWMANLTPGPLDVSVVPDIPVAGLPPGQYQIILVATPAGGSVFNDSYIWISDFTLGTVITLSASGSQEVPPVETTGTATANLGVDFDTGLMIGTVTFFGLSSNAVAAHFHRAPAGTSGPIFLDVLEGGLGGTSGVMNVAAGTILDADALDALKNNELYLNIHTTNNLDGEIRGQVIFPSVVPITVALSGDQEVPPVETPAVGTAHLSLDLATMGLSGTVTFSGLTGNATAAHFHRAPVGTDGDIDLDVLQGGLGGTSGVMNVAAGTFLTQDEFDAFTTNQHYINIHTTTNSGGEIRGQVIFPAGAATTLGAP